MTREFGPKMAKKLMQPIAELEYEPDYAIPPGETLQETLDALGMTQKELAVRAGLTPKTINRIVKGTDPISQQTAIRLERATGVPSRMWNNLEMNYRAARARIEDEKRLEAPLCSCQEQPSAQPGTRRTGSPPVKPFAK